MRAIYEPKGPAKEYGDLACNIYLRCPHGCRYCYAPHSLFLKREEYFVAPTLRPGFFEQLDKDLAKLAARWGDLGTELRPQIFLSFVGDPYCPQEEQYEATRETILRIHLAGFGVRILTKGGQLAERDFDLLSEKDAFGITLTTIRRARAAIDEPGAAEPADRVHALHEARKCGIPTWVSLEPVLLPQDALTVLHAVAEYADEVKIGRWNHSAEANKIDWAKFAADAVALCERLGLRYTLKKALRELV